MKISQALDLYKGHLEQRHMAGPSIDFKMKALAFFVAWMERGRIDDLRDVALADVRRYQSFLARKKGPNGQTNSIQYQHAQMWTLKDFYAVLHQRGRVLVNPCADLPPLRKPRRLPRGVITAAQVNGLLRAPDLKKPVGFRDRAMLELLYSSGLRGKELCGLSIYDVNFDKPLVRIVQGKGRKDRLVPVGRAALNYLRAYIDQVRPIHLARNRRRENLDRLFLTVQGTPFNTKYLYMQVKRYRKMAGLGDSVTTHSLRHACATEMLRGGASIRHVQEMLGHAHMSTTQIYTHVMPHDLKRIHRRTAPSEHRRVIDVPRFTGTAWNDMKNGGHYR